MGMYSVFDGCLRQSFIALTRLRINLAPLETLLKVESMESPNLISLKPFI